MDSARFAVIGYSTSLSEYSRNVRMANIKNAKAQYHIFIGDTIYWGKGIAQKATMLILNYGFNVLSLRKIWLEVNNKHQSDIHLYKKCGFTFLKNQQKEKIFMENQNNA